MYSGSGYSSYSNLGYGGYGTSGPVPGYNGVGVGGYPMAPQPGYAPQPYNTPPPYNQPSPYSPPLYNQPVYAQTQPFQPPAPTQPVYGQMPYGGNQPTYGQPYGAPQPQTGYFQGPDKDCEILHRAMHGAGTDEATIINLICSRDATQRAEIRRRYPAMYGKDLIKRIKEEISGNFENTVIGLFMTPPEYDAYCLYKAMKGIGTSEGVLIEILGTRNNQEIMMIKNEFQKAYGKPLEKWISSETSGNFKKLLIAIIQCCRSENTVPNQAQCQMDAQALYQAGEGRWGTDESTFVRIFTQRSAAELDLISNCYQQLRGRSLHQAIDKEFSGDSKKLLHTILEGLQDPAAYYAKRIRESVQGAGTNDSRLIRAIVSRCEVDLPRIKQAYQRLYGRDLISDVRSDTSGNYQKILTYLLTRV
jgi:annexin A7/11